MWLKSTSHLDNSNQKIFCFQRWKVPARMNFRLVYEAHRDTLALRSAAKKAFDAYKKENGSDKKLPRISELNAEYAMLLERKKSSYAE